MINYSTTNSLDFKVIHDLETAKSLWELFSPIREIDDDWDFRFTFFKYLDFPLHFIVAYHQDEPVGLLPLQLNTGAGPIPQSFYYKEQFLEFFGGDDTDSNQIFVKPGFEHIVPALLDQVRDPAVLAPLASPYTLDGVTAEVYTSKYTADLTDMHDFPDFLAKYFDGKGRGKLTQQLLRLRRSAAVSVDALEADDLDLLFEYNKDRFGELSSFQWPYRKQVFKDLMDRYEHDVFKVSIDGETKAVSFALRYKTSYLGMNIGYDYGVRDLGKFVVSTQIERAIAQGCNLYDSGKGDGGWKAQFHLAAQPQYMLTIPGAR